MNPFDLAGLPLVPVCGLLLAVAALAVTFRCHRPRPSDGDVLPPPIRLPKSTAVTPTNRLGYLTTDPVNAATAEALAAECGLGLHVVGPRDLPWLEYQGADLVVDWDFIPEDYQARLLNGTGANVVAVHGYNLGDGVAGLLAGRGLVCGRLPDHAFFQELAGVARAA
jgi:hypothetical protein